MTLLLVFTTVATALVLAWHWRSRQKDRTVATATVATKPTIGTNGAPQIVATAKNGGSNAASNPAFTNNVATMLEKEALFRAALAETRKAGTNDAPRLTARLNDLAELLYRQQRFAEAELLYRELIQLQQSYLPAEHRGVLVSSASLGRMLSDWAWAQYHAQVTATNTVLSGGSPLPTAPSPAAKISGVLPIDRAREAERILQRTLAARTRYANSTNRMADDLWRIQDVRSRLGGAVLAIAVVDQTLGIEARQSRFVEAEGLLLTSFERLQTLRLAANQKYKGDAIERLARLYEAWDAFAPTPITAKNAAVWRSNYDAFVASQSTGKPAGGTGKPVRSIPQRDPLTPSKLIDLSLHYNAALTSAWHFPGGRGSATLRDLPQGLQEFGGVSFDVRGVVQLAGIRIENFPQYPAQATNIQVRTRCRVLHFLHATGWMAQDGRQIGAYWVHYADGTAVEVPIVYGEHLREWHARSDRVAGIGAGMLAWEDKKPGTRRRLFQCQWENPKPEVEVKSIDFISAMTECFPFLIAVTAE